MTPVRPRMVEWPLEGTYGPSKANQGLMAPSKPEKGNKSKQSLKALGRVIWPQEGQSLMAPQEGQEAPNGPQ